MPYAPCILTPILIFHEDILNKNPALLLSGEKKEKIEVFWASPPGRLNYSDMQEVKPTPALQV